MPVLSYFLIFQSPGRLWGGLITQNPPLWLKYATIVLSHDKYKWSRRKLSALPSAFILEKFNTLTGNATKSMKYCCAQKPHSYLPSVPCHGCGHKSIAFNVKFHLLSLAQKSSCNLTTDYISKITSCHSPVSPLVSSPTWLPAILLMYHVLHFAVLPSSCLLFPECFSFIA